MYRAVKFRPLRLIILLAVVVSIYFAAKYGYGAAMKYTHPMEYTEYVEKYSEQYGVDKAIIYAVINCESSYDKNAISSAGALGLMQITPETFEWLQTKTSEDEQLPSNALFDEETAIKYGTLLISIHLEEFQNLEAALAAYHAGRGSVNNWLDDENYSNDGNILSYIPYGDTRHYVSKVEKNINIYRDLYGI